MPTAGMTALALLDVADIGNGSTVLVVGATGGVGSFATQIAAGEGPAPRRDRSPPIKLCSGAVCLDQVVVTSPSTTLTGTLTSGAVAGPPVTWPF